MQLEKTAGPTHPDDITGNDADAGKIPPPTSSPSDCRTVGRSQDTYSTATTIPPAFRRAGPWTASSSTTTGQGTRRSLSATRLRFLWYEIRTGQTLTDGDGPVQSGTVRYKMEFSEFAGLLYPIIGGGDSRSICRRDWTKNRPNDGCGTIGTN